VLATSLTRFLVEGKPATTASSNLEESTSKKKHCVYLSNMERFLTGTCIAPAFTPVRLISKKLHKESNYIIMEN
jgi:hypothetical protein